MALDLVERIKGGFTENLNLKLLSFAFALVLYALVHGSQDAQRSVLVDLVVGHLLADENHRAVDAFDDGPRIACETLLAAHARAHWANARRSGFRPDFRLRFRLDLGLNGGLGQISPV